MRPCGTAIARLAFCLALTPVSFFGRCPPAAAQTAAEQDALAEACRAISIDQCYRQGLLKLVYDNFIPESSNYISSDKKTEFDSLSFDVVADRDALGASAFYRDGIGTIRITSSVFYNIALFSNAAVLNIMSGKDLTAFLRYQEKVVSVLQQNTRRWKLSQPLLPTPSYDSIGEIEPERASNIMRDPTALGMTAYFSRVITYWVLAHEVGHHLLGHMKALAQNPGLSKKPMENAADRFASNALVKMGYSVYPTIFLLGYFAAIEESSPGDNVDYPPSSCRAANVLLTALTALGAPNAPAPIDNANRQWNSVMSQDGLRVKLEDVAKSDECRGQM